MTCNDDAKPIFSSTLTRKNYSIVNHNPNPLTCSSENIIYLITCSRCSIQYVGETKQKLSKRMNNHRTAIRGRTNTILTEHFREDGGCCISHCIVQPIEKIEDTRTDQDQKKRRLEREAFWIKELETLTPYGLNDRLDRKNWRYRWRDDIAGKCFNTITNNHKSRGSRVRKLSVRFLDALHSSFTNLTNWRNLARIKINSINTTELHNLSWTVVELSNDCNTTYPREIINLVLDMINFRLFLSKEADTKKNMNNFVKIYFQAKDIEEVRLSSIFRKEHPFYFSIQGTPNCSL